MSRIEQIEPDVFPGENDLEGLVEELGANELRKLLRKEGIFLSCQKEHLARLISRYYLPKSFYLKAFESIRRKEFGMALTGVRINGSDIDKVYEFISENRNTSLPRNRYKPRFVAVNKESDTELTAHIKYEKINPHFTSFHRRETFDVGAKVKVIGDSIEVSAFQTASADSIVVRDLTAFLAKGIDTSVSSTDLSILPVAGRVDLFDSLLKDSTKNVWRLEKCCGLAIRNGSDEDQMDLSDSQTQILHSAILDGENLRDHKIVKDLIEQTYFFSSASFFTYKDSSPDYHIRLKVDFKQNPAVLVITAESARSYSSEGTEQFEKQVVNPKIGGECVRFFWDRVHELYRIQVEQSQKSAKKVVRGG